MSSKPTPVHERSVTQHGIRFSTLHRYMVARITDMAIDVSLVTSCWDFSVCVCRVGETATNAIYGQHAYLNWENDADHAPDNALPEMIAKLEALLAESRQEVA